MRSVRLLLIIAMTLTAVRALATETAPLVATTGCLFDTHNPLCLTHDWNDDGVVSAADLHGYLQFVPVGSDEVRVTPGTGFVTLRSQAATARLDTTNAGLVLAGADGNGLTSVAAPSFKQDAGAVDLANLRDVQPTTRGITLRADAGAAAVDWSIELPTARSLRSRLRLQDGHQATRVVTQLAASAGERFYGLTERIVDGRGPSEIAPLAVGSLDRRGEIVTMMVTPTMGLYAPLFHSSRGYGVFVEDTMTGVYDLAKSDPDQVRVDFEFNQRTAEHSVRYFVGDHGAIQDEYTAVTGRPFAPPRWAFKHLRWRDEHRKGSTAILDGVEMNADLVNDLSMYDSLAIPVGNYEFDRPWTSGPLPPPIFPPSQYAGFASFAFDPTRFPHTDEMLAALRTRGYHIIVFAAPWALGDNATDAQPSYYAPRSGLLIDFTNPAAVGWWTTKVQTLIDLGISGIKLDRSEFDPTELPDAVPNQPTDIFGDGRTGREMMNGYTVDYARVHHDAFADRVPGDFFHYLRAGYAGSQQYGVFWGGDSPGRDGFGLGAPTDRGLRAAILQLARVAFMGFSLWGTDTGGYYQFGQRDVFARWLEFSALCPFMEIGGGNQGGGQHAPWDMPTSPAYDSEMIDIYRRYVTLHHELVPLFFSLALDAHASGRPLARPLVFDFPDDPNVADLWDEFLLGHDVLFAPLWHDGDRSRSVYLPTGEWTDYWQPTRHLLGPLTVAADAPRDRIPIYVRTGGIIPLDVASSVAGNGSQLLSQGRLTLDGYAAAVPPSWPQRSTVTLHEESGDSTFTLSDSACDGAPCIVLGLTPSTRGYIARLRVNSAQQVTLDAMPLAAVDSFAALESADRGWFFDPANERVWIKFDTNGAASNVVVR
ncbi:MAG TPA: TIM-barrel domain-containing protein [Candidatus Binatia bacterium]|nr:TIM-barrel domain-containing protein [Candidatus Binatia bacterium]